MSTFRFFILIYGEIAYHLTGENVKFNPRIMNTKERGRGTEFYYCHYLKETSQCVDLWAGHPVYYNTFICI